VKVKKQSSTNPMDIFLLSTIHDNTFNQMFYQNSFIFTNRTALGAESKEVALVAKEVCSKCGLALHHRGRRQAAGHVRKLLPFKRTTTPRSVPM
jgi:hypothetical protein